MNLSHREKNLGIVVVTIALLAAGISFVAIPELEWIEKKQAEIHTKTILIEHYQRMQGNTKGLEAFLAKYGQSLKAGANAQTVLATLLSELESIGTKNNAEIKWIKPQSANKNPHYKEVSVEVEMEGLFTNIFKTIDQIESSPSLIRVSEVKLSSQPNGLLSCRLTIEKIFF